MTSLAATEALILAWDEEVGKSWHADLDAKAKMRTNVETVCRCLVDIVLIQAFSFVILVTVWATTTVTCSARRLGRL